MSTDLTRAAARIRTLAGVATPGPWEADGSEIQTPYALCWVGETCASDGGDSGDVNASYIAAMHPGVGLALADLLDQIRASEDSPVGEASAALVAQLLAVTG